MKIDFDKLNKLTLPATILIVSIILGGFYFATQVNKQRSIERQQELKLEQEHKEYIAERRLECYELFTNEKKRVSNAENYGYVESYKFNGTPDYRDDTCEIIYKDTKTGEYFRKYR